MAKRLKVCLFYGAFPGQVFPLVKALEEYFDVDVGYLFEGEPNIPFEIDLPKVNKIGPGNIKIDKYDLFFGFDGAAVPLLLHAKEYAKVPVGCNLLDIPTHVFIPGTRNYLPHIHENWKRTASILNYLDFITSWKKIDIESIAACQTPMCALFHPVKPIKYGDVKPKGGKQLCYSGIVRPDKGVHMILEAISMADTSIKLLVLGVGPDLSEYAKYLKVPYEQIPNCSEADKYRHYYESDAIITYPDNPRIVSQCGLEALSIGKPVIAADWPEARRIYGDYGIYAEPFNVYDLSRKIKMVWDLSQFMDLYTKGAEQFCQEHRSNERWAFEFYEFLRGENFV